MYADVLYGYAALGVSGAPVNYPEIGIEIFGDLRALIDNVVSMARMTGDAIHAWTIAGSMYKDFELL